jgi:cytochrome d ubiquinol oxidase subunit I
MVLAAYLTTAFVVGGVAAWHLLRESRDPAARVMFSMAMWMALLVTPLQVLAGDLHGLNTFEYQPAKVAAMEGHYETRQGAPLILFGVPDDEAEKTRYAVEIPKLGSLILTHEWDGEVRGLTAWPRDERPPAEIVFYSFRVMVAVGMLMLLVGLWSGVARLRGTIYTSRWLHWATVLMGPSGFLAVLSGWITTEVGRQPYTVQGLLRTAESVSPLDAPAVGTSLFAFVVVYAAVFGSGTFYIMRLMGNRPDVGIDEDIGPLRSAGVTPGPSMRRDVERAAGRS